jgi:hypothetical protein
MAVRYNSCSRPGRPGERRFLANPADRPAADQETWVTKVSSVLAAQAQA